MASVVKQFNGNRLAVSILHIQTKQSLIPPGECICLVVVRKPRSSTILRWTTYWYTTEWWNIFSCLASLLILATNALHPVSPESPQIKMGQVLTIYQKRADTSYKLWKRATVRCPNKRKCLGLPSSVPAWSQKSSVRSKTVLTLWGSSWGVKGGRNRL